MESRKGRIRGQVYRKKRFSAAWRFVLCFRLVEDTSFRCLHAGPLIGFAVSGVGKDPTFEGFQNAIGGGRYSQKGNASLEKWMEHLSGKDPLLLGLC